MTVKPEDEEWEYVGGVEIGHWPYAMMGYGIATTISHTKIGTAIEAAMAYKIVKEHNKALQIKKDLDELEEMPDIFGWHNEGKADKSFDRGWRDAIRNARTKLT